MTCEKSVTNPPQWTGSGLPLVRENFQAWGQIWNELEAGPAGGECNHLLIQLSCFPEKKPDSKVTSVLGQLIGEGPHLITQCSSQPTCIGLCEVPAYASFMTPPPRGHHSDTGARRARIFFCMKDLHF